ncbi:MAG: hypothetical protein FJ221_18830 [Lentisphaerae bacterium]|nr:hypothetical protein [Lentisphaerota bacterium]
MKSIVLTTKPDDNFRLWPSDGEDHVARIVAPLHASRRLRPHPAIEPNSVFRQEADVLADSLAFPQHCGSLPTTSDDFRPASTGACPYRPRSDS